MPRSLLLALCLCFFSSSSLAVGFESCELVGKLNGKTIVLTYIEDEVYGLTSHKTYGYCRKYLNGRNFYSVMSCSSHKGGKETVRYEVDDNGIFICKSGCRKGVVKKFRVECHDDC